MSTHRINLLPWRETQFWEKSLKTFVATFLTLTFVLVCWYWLHQLNHRQYQQMTELKQLQQQQQSAISDITAKIEKWRQEIAPQTQKPPIATEQVLITMAILTELPLEQGELQEFQMDTNGIQFEGAVKNQEEFEALHQYLEAHFSSVNLVELKPQTNGVLHFHFRAQSPQL